MSELRKDFTVKGMHCQSCVLLVERSLKKQPGVKEVVVNLTTEKATVIYDPALVKVPLLVKAIEANGYQVVAEAAGLKEKEIHELLIKLIVSICLALPVLILSMGLPPNSFPFQPYLIWLFATLVQFIIGWQFYKNAFAALKSFSTNMDTLVALGTSAAYFYSVYLLLSGHGAHGHLYFETSSVLITVILLGKFLEEKAKTRASTAIKALMNLSPKEALVLKDGKEIKIITQALEKGDIIIIKPGDKIPVDGTLLEGASSVDESLLTGEAMPVIKNPGDKVTGGALNLNGAFTFRADRVGNETTLSQIIKLIEEAQGSKAPIQKFADTVSSWFVPAILLTALITFLAWFFIGHIDFSKALINAVSVLVIACPCALGLATPTAVMVGSGRGAQYGILIKSSEALEFSEKIKYMVFDKTGTITKGIPTVTALYAAPGFDTETILSLAATLEAKSSHPLAKAVITEKQRLNIPERELSAFEALPGLGLSGVYNNEKLLLGNLKLMENEKIDLSAIKTQVEKFEAEAKTVMILARGIKAVGLIAVSDPIKADALTVVKELKRRGISVYLLTGDNEKTATAIAALAGIDNVVAGVLPKDKAEKIKALQQKGITAMVGDGINDAPALAQADVGIALSSGTDAAMEAGNIVLMKNNLTDVIKTLTLSKFVMSKIRQNMFWALFYNALGVPLAALGFLNPMLAGAAMALSSVSVVSNSLLLKTKKL
ncbi:MAG: heavy metal translocating P-type ATPase [bacterium]